MTAPIQTGAIASTSRTLTTPATQQETTDVLKQLSNMDNILDDNPDDDITIPIAPQLQPPPQVTPKVEGSVNTDIKPPLLP